MGPLMATEAGIADTWMTANHAELEAGIAHMNPDGPDGHGSRRTSKPAVRPHDYVRNRMSATDRE
jgi:hypothetical protein